MDNVVIKAAITDFCLQYSLFIIAVCLKTDKFFYLAGSATVFVTLQSVFHCKTMFFRQILGRFSSTYQQISIEQGYFHEAPKFIVMSLLFLLSQALTGKLAKWNVGIPVIQSALVCIWGIRLGLFLLIRMWRDGHDNRFNKVKGNPLLFFLFWTVEGLWVWLILLPTLLVNSKEIDTDLCITDFIGWSLWLVGMLIECVADYQKFTFRGDSANKEKWINSGLWSIVRHPNYFGEILLWIGLFVSASSTFTEMWEFVSMASPVFIAFLLTFVSGIPLLEKLNWEKWKDNPKYQQYIKTTSRFVPYIY